MLTRPSRGYESYRERGRKSRVRNFVRFLLILLLVFFVVHAVFLQTVLVETVAMQPSLEPGDRLMMSPLVYGPRILITGWLLPGLSSPQRGDLVLIRPGFMNEPRFLHRLAEPFVRLVTFEAVRLQSEPEWQSQTQIKRIIGLPGDTVRMERFTAYVKPAGESRYTVEFEFAARPYAVETEGLPVGWASDDPLGDSMDEIVLAEDEYFVLADNRPAAMDSRHWGPIGKRDIYGRLIFRYWPFSRFGAPSQPR